MADTRRTKRSRSESTTSGSSRGRELADATRCPSVWFDDGNIILQVQGTQFRVHKGVLSRYSETLREKFADFKAAFVVDDCPVLFLDEGAGSETHWQNVLELLYDGRR
jgi:BTB/POZ domain